MATSKSVAPAGSGVEGILSLLNAFGQQSTSKGTANTAPLEGVLQQLQTSPDGTKLLESIFQQAAGQIPRLQAAYGNAVGARSGNNSSVQAALNELMKQTTLAGQSQLSQQQQNNQNMQLQAANGIAQATRGSTQTTQPNLSLGAKVIAGLQGINQLSGLYDKGKKLVSGLGGGADAGGGALFDIGNFSDNVNLPTSSLLSSDSWIGDTPQAAFDFGNFFTETAPSFTDIASNADSTNLSEGAGNLWDSITGWFGFADGGLVGRDGEEMGESSHSSAAEKAEPHGYANGGVVKSGGGRRSSAPTYTKATVTPTAAQNGSQSSGIPGSIPARGASGSPDLSGFGGMSGGGMQLPDLNGLPVQAGGLPRTPSDVTGSGSTATGIPNWLIGAVASIVGLNPVLSFALKQGNNFLTSIDPTNPGSKNAVNGSDSESDSAMNPAQPGLGGNAFGPKGTMTAEEQRNEEEKEFGYDPYRDLPGAGNGTDFVGGGGGMMDFGGFGSGGGGGFGGSYGGYSPSYGGGGVGQIASHANGGEIQGPGTGTSDSVPAKLSKGEYVISADVVDKLGTDFFDHLQKMLHTPTPTGA